MLDALNRLTIFAAQLRAGSALIRSDHLNLIPPSYSEDCVYFEGSLRFYGMEGGADIRSPVDSDPSSPNAQILCVQTLQAWLGIFGSCARSLV